MLIVAAWAALAVALALLVPGPLAESDDGTKMYLPEEYESQLAQKELRRLFPESYRPSLAVIVLHRPEGLTLQDMIRVRSLVDWLRRPALPQRWPAERRERIAAYLAEAPVVSAVTHPQLAARLNSIDRRSTLVVVGMPDIFTAQRSQYCVRAICIHLRQADLGGLESEITGDAGFYVNYNDAAEQSVDRSTLVTVVLVVLILLVVYRSPVGMLVPIITIALAVHVAMRTLYLLSPLGF